MNFVVAMAFFGFLFLAVMYFCILTSKYLRALGGELDERLESYAKMKGESEAPDVETTGLLSSGQHEVLLGTLKKVEAKNGTLFTALTFVAAATVALIASENGGIPKPIISGFLFLQIPFFWASLRGMKQVDQWSSDGKDVVEMQAELKNDLLTKEVCFRFSMTGIFLLITGGIATLTAQSLLE